MNTAELYQSYQERMQKIADLRNANAVLQWDQETYLPAKGASFRGRQISTLSEFSHQLFIDQETGDLLKSLLDRGDLADDQQRNVIRSMEDYTKSVRYPTEFVRRLSEQVNRAFHAWIAARKENSFGVYEPELGKLVDLKKQEADILGFEEHPYNALLDEFEKGCTIALVDKTFSDILPGLTELVDRITAVPPADDSFLNQHFPRQEQWEWGMFLIRQLHFDFERGRQDISEHPFSISFNRNDVRITTRIDEQDFGNMTWSCIHETGHALYEQGLPEAHYGLPLGEACSYSIHESQSRLWENNVGRNLPFWKHYFPILKERFPKQLDGIGLDQFYRGINKVQRSLVRTEADEVTYHFHVYIRYELEKQLIGGGISTKDIPASWSELYKRHLGVTVPDDRKGSLQDVHWSHGSFGYFPTYSLGSFYAAQLYRAATNSVQNIEDQISAGNTAPLLEWLRERIHGRGRYLYSEELCREATGQPLDSKQFLDYLLHKYTVLYNL